MDIRFDQRTVIVTGAAHGFGREMARQFVAQGANVWACDVLADELEETAALAGPSCRVRTVDVTDRDAVHAFVAE
ncbi:MAG TPA: SDR family NAD(P)-dependent oxidoreductase, partial [Longimicrobiales bacterium]|nr:SDR family NAD(P)-dependent oxidoreductase [Longimicrobiales bacterium]